MSAPSPPSVLDKQNAVHFLRYAIAGAIVMGVYTVGTYVLSQVLDVPIQLAIFVSYVASVCLHFALQRVFVFSHHEEFAHPMAHQARLYLVIGAAQYALTALSTAVLPGLLGLPSYAIYLATVGVLSIASFALLRTKVFHAA